MMRRRGLLRFAAYAALAAAVGACAGEAATPAKYSADACRQVKIVDAATGESIVGAEDLALDVRRARLFISAYDRRKAEKAARKRAFAIPEGGIYALSLADLLSGDGDIQVTSMVSQDEIGGGLRPHGLSFNSDAGEIAFINRAYQKIDGKWKMASRLERFGVNGEAFVSAARDAPCAANDLLDDGVDALISFDHGSCDWRAGLEDALSLKRSGVASEDGFTLYNAALYANGLVRTPAGSIALAATREKALLLLDETGDGLIERSRIKLPGGPDNLTLADDGSVLAAVHPSLPLTGLNRRLGFGAAPSRIVKVDPESGAVDVLFDDPYGAIFSAATVAVEWGGALIAGSATDEGLLVCQAAG